MAGAREQIAFHPRLQPEQCDLLCIWGAAKIHLERRLWCYPKTNLETTVLYIKMDFFMQIVSGALVDELGSNSNNQVKFQFPTKFHTPWQWKTFSFSAIQDLF